MSVFFTRRGKAASYGPPVGTTWLFESNDTFVVPADGTYQLELHGGGGGGRCYKVYESSMYSYYYHLVSGSGSGEIYEVSLAKGTELPVIIGAGGAPTSGATGGATSVGEYSVDGGKAVADHQVSYSIPAASGSIATDGNKTVVPATSLPLTTSGGEGNKNNVSQTYGDGGSVTATHTMSSGFNQGSYGQPGAVIITYLGI